MVNLNTAYLVLLFVGLALMLSQLLVKQKKLEHLFFAILCGSLAMVAAQQLSADALGPYQYIIGFGTCATCNAIWLVSKGMFSGESSITKKHVAFALSISVLIIINNSLHLAFELTVLTSNTFVLLRNSLGEITNLLSSTALALTCWEALKGISSKNKEELWQRIIFISAFCIGVFLCTVVAKAFKAPDMISQVPAWLVVISALQILLTTQVILWWQQYRLIQKGNEPEVDAQNQLSAESDAFEIEPSLITGINTLLIEDKRYLTQNLKMIDLANELNVSEYKISRAVRYHFEAPNFNHFVNKLRIEHAKQLLVQPESKNWTILVVALESGFSSLATFNRVFKAQLGYSPNEHRKNLRDACVNE